MGSFVDMTGKRFSHLMALTVAGNYEPSICRWATWAEQNKNKRAA
jgi:hypothetical protein